MIGQTKKYRESLKDTPFYEPCTELQRIRIDYSGLIEYANNKGVSVPDLSDEEKNRFVLNSNMADIMEIRHAEAIRTGADRMFV